MVDYLEADVRGCKRTLWKGFCSEIWAGLENYDFFSHAKEMSFFEHFLNFNWGNTTQKLAMQPKNSRAQTSKRKHTTLISLTASNIISHNSALLERI
jgi:hypothetical protein